MSKMKAILAMAALAAGFASTACDGAGAQGADPLSRRRKPVGSTEPIRVPYDKLFHYGTCPPITSRTG